MTEKPITQIPDPSGDPQRVRDAIVIGGGAAGLSAALTLARARRDVIVIDAGEPRNSPALGVHGFLSRDGIAPSELTRLGRDEVRSYGVTVVRGTVTTTRRSSEASVPTFTVTMVDEDDRGAAFTARRLVIATGLTDELPPVPGLAARWGRDVVHCPYCHGWEIRDLAIGVLGTSAFSPQQALLFRQWSSAVTLFTDRMPALESEQSEQLAARDIAVVDGPVAGLRVEDDRLTGVSLQSGRTAPIDALAVATTVHSNADALAGLGLVAVDHPSGLGALVPNDPVTGATTVPGVWVAGNVGDMRMHVVTAAASGVSVGAAVNADLIAEETAAAVQARRPAFGVRAEQANAGTVLGDRRHGLEGALR
jgi:thioredoxin reductase